MTVKRKRRVGKSTLLIIIGIIAVSLVLSGVALARYIAERIDSADTVSGEFHISSDLLEKTGATHDATDWVDGITFKIHNYEKHNDALVSEKNIEYKIDLPSGWTATVTDSSFTAVTPIDGVYTLSGESVKETHTVTIKCTTPASASGTVDVSINAVSPYTSELSAEFTLIGKAMPEYKAEDKGTYVLVTLYSNLYSGEVSFGWTAKLSPDNGDTLMSDWTSSPRSLYVTKNHTYELIFFKNTAEVYNKALTESTTVQIG